MIIKRTKKDKSVTLCDLCVGDTVLYQNEACMVVDRNGLSFVIDLATGRNVSISQNAELARIECILEYKVV